MCALKGNRFQLIVCNLNVLLLPDLVRLHDSLCRHLLARLLILLVIADAIACCAIDLMEANFLRSLIAGKARLDRIRRKAQIAFPLCTRGHRKFLRTVLNAIVAPALLYRDAKFSRSQTILVFRCCGSALRSQRESHLRINLKRVGAQ